MSDLDAIREDVAMAARSAEMARHVALDHAPELLDEVERLRRENTELRATVAAQAEVIDAAQKPGGVQMCGVRRSTRPRFQCERQAGHEGDHGVGNLRWPEVSQ